MFSKNLTRSAIEGIEAAKLENTFQPKVNSNAKAPLNVGHPHVGVHDRLSIQAEQQAGRLRDRESKKITEDARRAKKFSFKPEITKKGKRRGDDVKKTASRLYVWIY